MNRPSVKEHRVERGMQVRLGMGHEKQEKEHVQCGRLEREKMKNDEEGWRQASEPPDWPVRLALARLGRELLHFLFFCLLLNQHHSFFPFASNLINFCILFPKFHNSYKTFKNILKSKFIH